jgi:lipoyl(octanoyl) transferase
MIPIKLIVSKTPVDYLDAVSFMEQQVDEMITKGEPGYLWFLEHPPTITSGTSSNSTDLLTKNPDIPVYESGRGGQYTYHGPGQRIVYVMLDLRHFGKDIKKFIQLLEEWLINSLAITGLSTHIKPNKVGIWVENSKNKIDSKIAAIGLRVRRWVTYHGVAINVSTDLNRFKDIVPCGIKEFGVTSFHNEDISINMSQLDQILVSEFCKLFKTQVIQDA